MSLADNLNEKSEEDVMDLLPSQGEVLDAVHRRDWARLRTLSLRAGGFGDERRYVWYVII